MLNRDFARKVMFVCFTDIQPAMFSVKSKNILLMVYTEIAFSLKSFLLTVKMNYYKENILEIFIILGPCIP